MKRAGGDATSPPGVATDASSAADTAPRGTGRGPGAAGATAATTPKGKGWQRLAGRHLWDRVAALIIVALAVVLLVTSVDYGFYQQDRPGPGLFPAIMATLLLLAAMAWLITGAGPEVPRGGHQSITAELVETADVHPVTPGVPEVSAAMEDPHEDHEDSAIDRAGLQRMGLVVVWTVIPLALLEPLGYLITMAMYVGGLLAVLARVRVWVAAAAALVGSALTARGADALGIVLPDPFGLLRFLGA